MNNPRITKKERGLIKGALRRVFSRSDLRNAVITASLVEHSDPERPRVKNWCRCNVCKKPEARSYMAVDHLSPLIPIDSSFENMSLDVFIDRLWCDISNLQAICVDCHDKKSKIEAKERRCLKKAARTHTPEC